MAVLSNKPHVFTEKCVSELLSRWSFDVVLGQRDSLPRKPDPSGALQIARDMQLDPSRFLYLGDTGVDMQTAVRANMYPVAALWGFRQRDELARDGARAFVDEPTELLKLALG